MLNEHNIGKVHTAILDGYRYDLEDSLPNQIKRGPFWGLMHDNIAKFGKEFNGVLLCGVSMKSLEPTHAPHALRQMKGGVNAYDVVDEIFDIIAGCIGLENSAFQAINAELGDDNENDFPPVPPSYFKLATVEEVKETEIHLSMDPKVPVLTSIYLPFTMQCPRWQFE